MDRRYYWMRGALLIVAVITVAWTGNYESRRMAHAVNQARFSAPAQIEQAVAQAIGNFLRGLFRRPG